MYKKAPRYSYIEQDKCIEPVKDDEYFVTGGRVDTIVRNDSINENDFEIEYVEINHSFKCKLICEKI